MQTFDSVDDVLAHYGVKGMRWGVRRSEKQLAKARSERSGEKSESKSESGDAKAAAAASEKASKKGIDSLSNDELKLLTERLNLEKNYERLTAEPPPELSTGKKAAQRVSQEAGNVALNVGRQIAAQMLRDAVLNSVKK